MTRSKVLNMTEGNPLMLLIVFSIPMLIGNLFQQVYNIADSIIVGRLLGAGALAAVGATHSVSFLFFSVCNGMGNGGGIVTSQYFGAGDEKKIRGAITNSAYLMFAASIIMGIISFFATPSILKLMGTPEEILSRAVTYMRMACISVPLVGIYNYAASMLRALGDSKTPLLFLVVACVLNIILDLLFVGPLAMGVFGAALATTISQFLAGLGCLYYAFKSNPYFKLKPDDFRFNREISLRSMRLGFPLALQWSMIAVSTTGLQAVVNSFGTTAVAAFTASSRIENLVHMPFGSLGQALSTYAGQNYGARNMARIKTGFRQSCALMAGIALGFFVIMQLCGHAVISIFVKDPSVIELGARGLRITSMFYLFLGLIYVTRGIQNGVGDALFSFLNGMIEMIARIGLPMLLLRLPGANVTLIWQTAGLTWMISCIFCFFRYLRWNS